VAQETIVLDTSIVVKWFLVEPLSQQALRIRDDYVKGPINITAPELLLYEVLNALRYSKAYTVEELVQIGISLNKYRVRPVSSLLQAKGGNHKTSIGERCTIYDASYVAPAKHLGTGLYTADAGAAEKVPGVAFSLEEYGATRQHGSGEG
jgi:predicted nucleic acid-binding protein